MEQNLIREYDGLVGLTMLNIYSISKEKKIIHLKNFNKKNREHLYILRVALMARSVYNFPIEVEGKWWNIFTLNQRIKKGFDKIKRCKLDNRESKNEVSINGEINVPELLNLMRSDGIKRLGKGFTFANIYYQYYRGSLD